MIVIVLKANLGLGQEDCQHAVIDEFLCMLAGLALGTGGRHWMLNTFISQHGSRSTRFPFENAKSFVINFQPTYQYFKTLSA